MSTRRHRPAQGITATTRDGGRPIGTGPHLQDDGPVLAARARAWNPEHGLLQAILESAVEDVAKGTRENAFPCQRRAALDAIDWMDGATPALITFPYLCEQLGLEASWVRKQVDGRRMTALHHRHVAANGGVHRTSILALKPGVGVGRGPTPTAWTRL